MKRRDALLGIGSALVAWPLRATAQPSGDSTRLVGALLVGTEDDPESRSRIAAFERGLAERGWVIGRNLRVEYRWSGTSGELVQNYASELVAKAPDILLSQAGGAVALRQLAGPIPIVTLNSPDPVGQGLVTNMAHPGGTLTGFTGFEPSLVGRALQFLKEIAPHLTHVGVLGNPGISFEGYYQAAEQAAPHLKLALARLEMRNDADVVPAIEHFAESPDGGLLVSVSPTNLVNRDKIIDLAARHRMPAMYPYDFYARRGGLVSYGIDVVELFHRSAAYVDRILRGEAPGDLPVQTPDKFRLVINRGTAAQLRLAIPQALLLQADEVVD